MKLGKSINFSGVKPLLWVLALVILVVGGGLFFSGLRKGRMVHQRYQVARNLMEKMEYGQAIPLLKEIYQGAPTSTEGIQALYELSICHTETGNQSMAEAYWEELEHRDVRGSFGDSILFYKGMLAEKAGRPMDAERYYNDLLGRYRDSDKIDRALLRLGMIYEKQGDLLKARDLAREIIEMFPQTDRIDEVQRLLGDLNVKLLFSKKIINDGSTLYQVSTGDTLIGIANAFGTTVELLQKTNGIKKDLIHPGQKLKVINGRFSLLADKSMNSIILRLNDEFFKIYTIGTGRENSTPVGEFKIINKLKDPPWYRGGKAIPYGDPENILGTRWMGFNKAGYGIHGTWDPDSVGKQSSAGCIRLRNQDVEELYKIVSVGVPVTIVE